MAVPNYAVLKGDPISGKVVSGNSPHYQIQVKGDQTYTVAVNIQSVDKSQVWYSVDHAFQPPDAEGLRNLPVGLKKLESAEGGLAIDYVRSRINGEPMIAKSFMSLLPVAFPAGHKHNDLNNEVVDLLNRAVADKEGTIYAFGSSFADPGGIVGIHDIHMNQGNPPGDHDQDNGVWQDGAIFMDLPSTNSWVAVFIAFQTQEWDTDDQTGDVK